ncbi:hypothetical protein OG613_45130 (plasmid) [Streptomyces sp. NBC_00015]|uniref:hypothetical protein n=1 Tax=Streptomyces sp. NBC_00015 TaxID=2903611 RepID=UPI002F90ACCF
MHHSAQRTLWRRFEDEHDDVQFIGDTCKEVRAITEGDGVGEPGDVIALAIAGAEAADGVLAGLDSEWALYTPQQVAYTASALCAQITAAGQALEKLDAHLDVMAERGDIAMPDPDRAAREADEAGRLGLAQTALGSAGYAASTAVAPDVEEPLRRLAAAQRLAPLPADAHETITEVGRLLGDAAKLFTADHVCRTPRPALPDREQCRCRMELTTSDGALWDFRREDGEWCLVRRADGHWIELAAADACADPRHVTALIRQAVRTAP